MSARHTLGLCPITPARLLWLQHLAKHGETPWGRMPKNSSNGSPRHMTSKTWRPMVDAGLITSRFGTRHFSEFPDHLFTITDAGRAAIAESLGATS